METPPNASGFPQPAYRFDPTYKGWKLNYVRQFGLNGEALILPTRDGNLIFDVQYFNDGTSFDPTYKGWKRYQAAWPPGWSHPLWSYLQGMETRARWRGGNFKVKLWSYLQGMETTYFAASLTSRLKLWSYLQGMETHRNSTEFPAGAELWSYLQGMETPFRWASYKPGWGRFDPTYKGWKRFREASESR